MNPPILPGTTIQYSLTVDDQLVLYRFIHGYRNKKLRVYIRLFLYNFLSAIDAMYLTSVVLYGAGIGRPIIVLVLSSLIGIGMTIYVVQNATSQFSKTVLRHANLRSRYERGDFQHNVLQISKEGLIEETPTNRTFWYWEDGIEIRALDKERTVILLVNGWGGAFVLPAKGIETGDYEQFLADARRMAELYRHPQKATSATSASEQEDVDDAPKEITYGG